MMMNNDFINGVTTSVRPSAAILTEYMRNGWTQKDIDRALSTDRWVPIPGTAEYDENPFEEYKHAVGYQFDWGHILERSVSPKKETPVYSYTWDFCLDAILSKVHKVGANLGDLSDYCLDCLDTAYLTSHRNKLTWPVEPVEGAPFSCFSLLIQTTDQSDNAAQKIEAARKWIATTFMADVLPGLMEKLDKALTETVRTETKSFGAEALQ